MLPLLLLLLAQPQPPNLFPVTRSATKQGSGLVAVSAPTSPWSVAQLHIKLAPDEVTPAARAATAAWAKNVAEAGRKAVGPNGTVELRVTPDSVVVSYGVEAARADDAARAVDAALRAKGQKPAANGAATAPNPLNVVDDTLDAEQSRVLFAGQAISLPITAGDAGAAAKALGDAVTADRVVVVFVAPDAGDVLLAKLNRIVTAPLYKAPPATSGVLHKPGKAIVERQTDTASTSTSTIAWLIPPRADGAGLQVLAHLMGGRSIKTLHSAGVVVDVTAPDRVALVAAEEDALDQMRRIAAAAPPPEVVEDARAKVSTTRLSLLTDPAKVAHALGQAALEGRPSRVEDELASLTSTIPQHVSLAAAALAQAHVVIQRTPGPEPQPPPPPPTPPPAPSAPIK